MAIWRLAMETTLDRFGRIVLPKQVRDDLGLAPGAVLKVEEREEGILLKPVEEAASFVREGTVLVFTGEAQGDLEVAIRLDREERARNLAGIE
jgi:AbrB family looped-hinge helix DNA binding protein